MATIVASNAGNLQQPNGRDDLSAHPTVIFENPMCARGL
jgi:hypothetical protein